ncbi:hypothetical protein PSP6_350010 [Paraburkholderia tropica]|nr:hypothetical protein PSP6_350010 [Paraburkholderia tropica]
MAFLKSPLSLAANGWRRLQSLNNLVNCMHDSFYAAGYPLYVGSVDSPRNTWSNRLQITLVCNLVSPLDNQ